MNGAPLLFFIILLACHGAFAVQMKGNASAAEKVPLEAKLNSDVMALSTRGVVVQVDRTQFTQVLTTVLGLLTSMVSAFVKVPPDFEYAFDTTNIQGWQIIKLVVPEESQMSQDFQDGQRAWRVAFADAGELKEELIDSSKKGNVSAIFDSVMRIVDTALETVAKAVPNAGDLILAINDLVQGNANSVFDFGTSVGWLDGTPKRGFRFRRGKFAVQSDTLGVPAMESQKLVQLLKKGVGIVEAFVSAFSQNPPDRKMVEYAFDHLNFQGWDMVKLLVPESVQTRDSFKKAENAWKRVFSNAAELTLEMMRASEGDSAAFVTSILMTVDTALKTAAYFVEPGVAKILDGAGSLVLGVGGDWVLFSSRVGWLS